MGRNGFTRGHLRVACGESNREVYMDNQDNELRKVVQELANEEGISFADALEISTKALRYEIQRRKSFSGKAAECGSASSLR